MQFFILIICRFPTGVPRSKWEPEVAGPFHMMRRCGEMAEVAAAVTFLCSADASYINGELVVGVGVGVAAF